MLKCEGSKVLTVRTEASKKKAPSKLEINDKYIGPDSIRKGDRLIAKRVFPRQINRP